MDLIPPEILLHIFEYIGGPAPSETRLHDQPSLDLLTTGPGCSSPPLKAVSLVSRSWRFLVLPCLFRHILWKPSVYSLSAFTLNPIPLLRFLTENRLARSVVTFALVIKFDDPAAIDLEFTPRIRTADLEWLWDQIFSVIDPLRFTILARPTTMAALLSCMLYLNDAWSFDIPYHIFSFARSTRQIRTESGTPSGSTSTDVQSVTPTVSSASRRVPTSSTSRIDRLFVQLTPKPGNSILDNRDEMRHIDPGDLWLERDTSYTLLMRELMLLANPRTNWSLLQVFESGDVVDTEAWEMIVQFLEHSETKEWKVERPGIFAKITDDGQSTSWVDEVNGHIGEFTNDANSSVL
ncbi:hypothetical protein E0Z10_g8744 [Xylaria hypoxylon]|uniref:Uncharacterized protein n=1 Tax=Xylaria hypoxylon TaxID=37992 RepID=A0A4Z0YIY8_9PEZI|nr:hypothetical protein E0Z10_g8744 [Xylaria hypoxylon]